MSVICNAAPIPSDYFGVLWALAGLDNSLILEHGATGTTFYTAVSFGVMNKQSPKGIIFSTGIDEDDVIMGREDRIVRAAKELDERYHPDVLSLAATAVTSVIGIDLHGLISELQPGIRARLLAFPGGGFRGDYTVGIREVFTVLIDSFVTAPTTKRAKTVNLIGPTIDSFNHPSDFAEIKRLLDLLGVEINTVFSQNTGIRQIRDLPAAALNIVTRDIGLAVAEQLQLRFGTPYHYGLPFGIKGTIDWLTQIAEKLGLSVDRLFIARELRKYGQTLIELTSWWQRHEHLRFVLSCSYEYALGLTRLIREEWGLEVVAVALPTTPAVVGVEATFAALGVKKVLIAPGENEWRKVLAELHPQVIFGSSSDFRLAPEIPIKIHAAIPAYDYLNLFDGTPFVGFRGSLHLTQTFINQLNMHRKEV